MGIHADVLDDVPYVVATLRGTDPASADRDAYARFIDETRAFDVVVTNGTHPGNYNRQFDFDEIAALPQNPLEAMLTNRLDAAIFAVLGDNLPSSQRATGFGVQSILKRIPIILAPPLGGWLIGRLGFLDGVRAGLRGNSHETVTERPDQPPPDRPTVCAGRIAAMAVMAVADTAKFDLMLTLAEEADGLVGGLEYDTDLFDATTIDVKGPEFRLGIVRGTTLGGEWGVSLIHKRLSKESTVAIEGTDDLLTVVADDAEMLGVEVHKFIPFARAGERVQVGLNLGGGRRGLAQHQK